MLVMSDIYSNHDNSPQRIKKLMNHGYSIGTIFDHIQQPHGGGQKVKHINEINMHMGKKNKTLITNKKNNLKTKQTAIIKLYS